MIFKTFDSNIDKISAKWGIFGRSFNTIGDTIIDKVADFNEEFEQTGKVISSWKNSDSIWRRLYPKKEDIQAQILDVDELFPKIDTSNIKETTKRISEMSISVAKGEETWQNLFETLPDGEKHLAQIGQQLDGQIVTTDKVVEASDNLRQSVIDQNKKIKQSTLAFKAKTLAVKALSLAMNIGLSLAINAAISLVSSWVHAQENARKAAQEATDAFQEEASAIDDYIERATELRKELDKGNLSYEDAQTARSDLMAIQDELIKKYGKEAEGIDLVTGSITDQTKAIHDLKKAEYADTYGLDKGNIDSTIGQVNEQTLNLDFERINSFLLSDYSDELQEIKANVYEILKDEFKDLNIEDSFREYEIHGNVGRIKGDIYSIDEALKGTFQRIDELNISDKYEDEINKVLTYISSVRNDWSNKIVTDSDETFSEWVKYGKEYSDDYYELIRQQENTRQAIANGTSEEIEQAKTKYAETYERMRQKALEEGDLGVVGWLERNGFADFLNELEIKTKDVSNTAKQNVILSIKDLETSLSSLDVTLDSTLSNQSTIQSAFDKIQEGASLSADEVLELKKLCPELQDDFEQTADGWTVSAKKLIDANENIVQSTKDAINEQIELYKTYLKQLQQEEARKVILSRGSIPTDALEGQLENFDFSTLDMSGNENYKKAEEAIAGLTLMLSMCGLTVQDTTEKTNKFAQISEDVSSKVNLISTATKEMNDNGHISASTYADIIEQGGDYAKCLEIVDGRLVLNIEKLKELEAQEYETELAALKLARTQMWASAVINSASDYNYYKTLEKDMLEQAAALQSVIDEIYSAGNDTGDTTDIWKAEFDSMYSEWKHKLALKQVTESEYIDWLDGAYKHYFSDLTKYQSEYWQYEEEVYSWRKEKEQELFDEKIENIEKLAEKTLDDDTDKSYGKYDKARKYYERAITTTQNRIQTLISSGTKDISDELDNLYDKLESYNDKIKEINNDEENQRISDETRYWEQLQDKVSTYYDEELKKLEDIESEQDKINRKEELRLEILEAENKLLEARENRNRLVFENGGFSYQADQAEIDSISAELSEKRKSLDEEIFSEKMDEQKSILQQQKENAEKFFNSILQLLSNYEQKLSPVTNSDKTTVQSAIEWENANKNISGTEENKIIKFISDALNMGLNTKDTMNYTLQMLSKAADSKIDTNINNYGNLSANDGLKLNNLFTDYNNSSNETINNIKNNTNNQNITFGNMHFDIQCGDSNNIKQSVSEAFEEFTNSFKSELTRLVYEK